MSIQKIMEHGAPAWAVSKAAKSLGDCYSQEELMLEVIRVISKDAAEMEQELIRETGTNGASVRSDRRRNSR